METVDNVMQQRQAGNGWTENRQGLHSDGDNDDNNNSERQLCVCEVHRTNGRIHHASAQMLHEQEGIDDAELTD